MLLLKTLRLAEDDLYLIDGPVNPTRLMALAEGDHSPELRDPPFVAPVAAQLRERPDLFAAIRERDILLHHPYENFNSVVRFPRTGGVRPGRAGDQADALPHRAATGGSSARWRTRCGTANR